MSKQGSNNQEVVVQLAQHAVKLEYISSTVAEVKVNMNDRHATYMSKLDDIYNQISLEREAMIKSMNEHKKEDDKKFGSLFRVLWMVTGALSVVQFAMPFIKDRIGL